MGNSPHEGPLNDMRGSHRLFLLLTHNRLPEKWKSVHFHKVVLPTPCFLPVFHEKGRSSSSNVPRLLLTVANAIILPLEISPFWLLVFFLPLERLYRPQSLSSYRLKKQWRAEPPKLVRKWKQNTKSLHYKRPWWWLRHNSSSMLIGPQYTLQAQ